MDSTVPVNDNVVKPLSEYETFFAIKLNLWMIIQFMYIFSKIVQVLANNFHNHHVRLGMVNIIVTYANNFYGPFCAGN